MDALSRIRKTVNEYQNKITLDDADGNLAYEIVDVIKPAPMKGMAEATRVSAQYGNTWRILLNWRGKLLVMRFFFPFTTKPTRDQVQHALDKIYPQAKIRAYFIDTLDGGAYVNAGEMRGMLGVKAGGRP
jgi:hypothetical protein